MNPKIKEESSGRNGNLIKAADFACLQNATRRYYPSMKACMTTRDIALLGGGFLKDHDESIGALDPGLCGRFHMAAELLEAKLVVVYQMVALKAREVEEMAEVAAAWGAMVELCDSTLTRLHQLTTNHPACGAEQFYDRTLDLRNRCLRLQKMHLAPTA